MLIDLLLAGSYFTGVVLLVTAIHDVYDVPPWATAFVLVTGLGLYLWL